MARRPQLGDGRLRDGLDEMGLDGLIDAAAWQCLGHFVLVPRLDWFLFWCLFFEMIG